MSTFNQRGQTVRGNQTNVAGNQYIAGGDIRFGDARNQAAFTAELEKLLAELARAAQQGQIAPEAAVDAEGPLKKAVLEAKKPVPDKSKLLDYVDKAKTVLTDLAAASTAAASLGGMLGVAYEAIKRLF